MLPVTAVVTLVQLPLCKTLMYFILKLWLFYWEFVCNLVDVMSSLLYGAWVCNKVLNWIFSQTFETLPPHYIYFPNEDFTNLNIRSIYETWYCTIYSTIRIRTSSLTGQRNKKSNAFSVWPCSQNRVFPLQWRPSLQIYFTFYTCHNITIQLKH